MDRIEIEEEDPCDGFSVKEILEYYDMVQQESMFLL